MPKGVYPHTHIKPRAYPAEIVTLVRHMYETEGMTIAEIQRALPRGFKAQRIVERHVPERRRAAKRDQRGNKNHMWRELDAGYKAAHLRVASARGAASGHRCVDCGCRAADWSYNHTDPDARSAPDGTRPYSLNPDHYSPRCRPCHRAFDSASRKKVMPNDS